jgi:hypothetical protein
MIGIIYNMQKKIYRLSKDLRDEELSEFIIYFYEKHKKNSKNTSHNN